MTDESIRSRPPPTGAFTVEHDRALHLLKQHGSVKAHNPEEEHVLAEIAAAGLAKKEGDAYVCAGSAGFLIWLLGMARKIWDWVPQVIVSLLLLWALKPHNPYGYYILLRWVCCAVFAYLAFRALAQGKQSWVLVLGITAVVYNPIIRVHLTREIWSIINVVTIGIAIASIFAIKAKERGGGNPHERSS